MTNEKTADEITCPFCGDNEFDKIGLKNHIICGYCEEFNNTEDV